ncbi:MAG: M48 family metalloprotease, partial [Sphingomonadaceae bacterium]|nr:M48 family metalloprotease [Sphingomonadaceae bacterium]
MPRMKSLALASSALIVMAFPGCVANGKIPSASTPITPAEASQGAELHPQLLQEFGGAMSGPHAAYVESVGQKIAVQSGLSTKQGDFTVTLLNSPVNNAFAIPGGYVYTTRQLVALMNNEAELAGVMGHEVGHVAARHSQRRQKAAQKNNILGAGLAILSGVLLGDSSIGSTLSDAFLKGSQLLTLKFSRKQETQADNLGIQYLSTGGYDPRAMGTVLQSLAAQNALDAQLLGRGNASVPEWASTHPNSAKRVKAAFATAGSGGGALNRDTFLTRIDGILYGDDPEQGVIEGSQFIHPKLGFSFTAPNGFYMVNGTRAVSINGQSGQAQMSTGAYSGNLESYVNAVFKELGGEKQTLAPSSVQRTTVNGIPALYGTARVNNGNSQVDVVVFAYEFSKNQAFHFAAISPAGQSGVFTPMYNSMRRISSAEASAVIPRRIDVVTVKR